MLSLFWLEFRNLGMVQQRQTHYGRPCSSKNGRLSENTSKWQIGDRSSSEGRALSLPCVSFFRLYQLCRWTKLEWSRKRKFEEKFGEGTWPKVPIEGCSNQSCPTNVLDLEKLAIGGRCGTCKENVVYCMPKEVASVVSQGHKACMITRPPGTISAPPPGPPGSPQGPPGPPRPPGPPAPTQSAPPPRFSAASIVR